MKMAPIGVGLKEAWSRPMEAAAQAVDGTHLAFPVKDNSICIDEAAGYTAGSGPSSKSLVP